MAAVNSSQKTAIYHTLYLLNLSFARIVTHCQTFNSAGVLRRKFNRLYQAYAQELQAEINDEVLQTVSASNMTTLTASAESETLGTRNCATPMMFSSMPRNAERNSPNNARNADSLSQLKPDRPAGGSRDVLQVSKLHSLRVTGP
jgi:hypothetical protein